MNIILTGASKGIGYETALQLAARGGNSILAIARSEKQLKELKNKVDAEFSQSHLDYFVFDFYKGDFNLLKKEIRKQFKTLDILINNAGFLIAKPFLEISADDFDQTFTINIKSVFQLCQLAIPLMKKGSHIVNISSMGGVQGSVKFSGLSAYSASKGALSVLTESLAVELNEKGIAVNALALGAVDTAMLRLAFPHFKAPLTAQEMGAYVAEFATTGSSYFNGKIVPLSVSTP